MLDAGGGEQPVRAAGFAARSTRRSCEHCAAFARTDWTKIDELPFDFERRRVSVLVEHGQQRAPDRQRERRKTFLRARQLGGCRRRPSPSPLDASARVRCRRSMHNEAAQGNPRAWRSPGRPCRADRAQLSPEDERDLVIAGFCVFVDPPKPSAAEADRAAGEARVCGSRSSPGTSDAVVRHVAARVGMPASRHDHRRRDRGAQRRRACGARRRGRPLCPRVARSEDQRIIRALQAARPHGRVPRRRGQ